MSTELPPLPEPLCSAGVDHGYLTVEQTIAYGQQCRNAALLEAAELCERDVWPDDECSYARVDTGEILGRMLRAKVKEQK